MPRPRVAAFLLGLGAAASVSAATPEAGRLPAGVTPLHYDIMVDPDAAAMTFTGDETVTIAVARPTRTITLNALDLTIGKVTLDGVVQPSAVALDPKAQTLAITFTRPVAAGEHRLSIAFAGKINASAAGFFAVDYQETEGSKAKDRRLLVTQFEPADARLFAPMWDEPGRKATFTLTAATPRGQTAFSNMPIAKTVQRADGKTLVTFETTPKMSSYLLFLGMGDVERRTTMVGKTEIGVITRKGALDQGDYALASAARILAYYNAYFGTPYPLPKLDMIAAPGSSQFFSAMENWGAILYFDRAVLLDPRLSSENDRQNVFNTVAHEMAHQWFGDLVTMDWWDDLWLNEGYASWMAGKVANDLNPGWNVAAQDVAFDRQRAFAADARASTHPIVQPIATVDQISQAFDTITYQKGQATIGMIEAVLGPDRFRDGVRAYMKAHAYGNTRTDDLWAALSAASGRDVKRFADSFIRQGGVPLIRGGEPLCKDGQTTIALSQARFGLDAASKEARSWIVPVAFGAGGAAVTADISGPRPQPVSAPGCGLALVDPGQQGYYRFLPADVHFAALAGAFSTLPLADQVGLLGDSLGLADSDDAPIARYLTLLDGIPVDADPLVWDLAAAQLTEIDGSLAGDAAQPAFRAKAIARLAPVFARIGGVTPRAGEAAAASQLRERLIVVLGRFGDSDVAATARRFVAAGIDTIPAPIRQAVFQTFAYNATPAEWDRLHQAVRAEPDPTAKRALYQALAQPADPALTDRALALALSDEPTVPNRAAIISYAAARHPAKVFDWAAAHADQVNALVESRARPRFIPGLASGANDAAVAERVRAYAERALPEQSRQGADTAISAITSRAALRARRSAPIAAWARQ
jgi:aminopeptidase N